MIDGNSNRMKKLVLSYELAWRTEEDKKFMRTVEWKNIRKKILDRDNYTCQYCNVQRKDHMQVNHVDGNPKNHSDENLEVICASCHKITHSGLWVVVFKILDVYEESKYDQNSIVRITGKMRDDGKPDEEIIKFLGLKKLVLWQQDLEYLSKLYGFVSSRKIDKKNYGITLTEEEQQSSLKKRDKW